MIHKTQQRLDELESVIVREQDMLFRFAYLRVGSRADAEDIVQDDLRDFRKLGAPRLYFGVNSGAMDSMVNHYTAAKRLRSDDAYTPEGKAGQRPDYAVTVYTKILKEISPDIPDVA